MLIKMLFVCLYLSVLLVLIHTWKKSVSKRIQKAKKGQKKDPEMCLFHVLIADFRALTLFCHYLITESNSNFFSSLLLDLLERYADIHLSPSPTRDCQAFGFSWWRMVLRYFLVRFGFCFVVLFFCFFLLIHGMLSPFMLHQH